MAGPEQVVTKGEFAEICSVSPSRVSQWIKEGKISGTALVGTGRDAKILVGAAQKQLRLRLDSGQAFGNGLNTKLRAPSTAEPALPLPLRGDLGGDALADPDALSLDALDQEIKRQKLETLQRANRKAAEEEAAAQGRYTETAGSLRQMTMVAAQTLRFFEGALPEIASALAAEFKVEERDVLLILNDQVHKVRERATQASKRAAEGLPALIEEAAPEA